MKKIIEMINRYLEEKNKIEEEDYDKRMCLAEDTVIDIQRIAKQPKSKKYCNLTREEHSNPYEVYSTWDLDSITKGAKWTVYNSRVDAEEHGDDYCSIPMEDFLEKL